MKKQHLILEVFLVQEGRLPLKSKSMKQDRQAQGNQSIAHLVMVVLAVGLELVWAKPCYEGSDFELCFLSKSALHDETAPDIREQFNQEHTDVQSGQKYDIVFVRRDMRDISEEYKKCSGCDEEADVVDREDHVTQYLSELMVNTDSEITSLQASDVEETREDQRNRYGEDGYFAFLTGEEKIFEVEGVWSEPAKTVVDESEMFFNA